MKKMFAILVALSLTFTFGLFSASAETSDALKLGLNIQVDLTNSSDASADAEGLVQVDADAIAVLVDANGVIVDAYIDAIQAKMPFTAQGKLGESFPTEFLTKNEMGTGYGMSTVSKVGEWDAQIEALRAYLIGKNAEQVQGIAVDDATHPTDADLTAGCTMAIGSYLSGVVAAIGKAVPCDAAATDRLGIGIVSSANLSADASADADGKCEANTYYAVVTVNEAGAVSTAVIDSTKSAVTFNTTGVITSDLTASVPTLLELGDAYGMRSASSIGKEWFEQANAFSAYVIGKTAAEIDGIAISEDGKPTGADLTASVTLPIGTFKDSVLKAISYAK